MRALMLAFAFMAFGAGAASAQDRFVLDPNHTQVTFSIDRQGYTRILGRFDAAAGEVMLDAANPTASSVHATVDMNSLSTGYALRDEHLRADRWLNTAAFTTMEFQSTSVRMLGERRAEVTGNLTLHGVTAPLTLDVTLNQLGPGRDGAQMAGFTATGALMRSAFGISAGLPGIGDEVRIEIQALAMTPPAQ